MPQTILITRPEPQASELEKQLRNLGFETFKEPMLTIQKIDYNNQGLDSADGYIFTSRTAFDFLEELPLDYDLPVFVVGEKTALAAQKSGFKHIQAIAGNVENLAEELKNVQGNFVYFRGEYVSHDLNTLLIGHRALAIQNYIVYTTHQVQQFSDKLLKKLDNQEILSILFYSKRTADAFVKALQNHKKEQTLSTITALCLADSVLECLSVLPWRTLKIALNPNQQSLIEMLNTIKG
ncbi:MAG: uroporphyrinogen-III synthase [Pseudomonadota bacterium]